MAEDLRFGVIGLGRAGAAMLAAMAVHPDIRVTAAADLYQEHLNRFRTEFEGETYKSAEELCTKADVDAVYIATPHEYHVEHVVTAANHGKHVIVEKPMALTLEDSDRIIEAVEKAGVKLVVGHTASFNPAVKKMRELVVSGEVGRLGMISATAYTDFLYRPRRPEELVTELGGGIIYNQVPHQVDAARFIAGGMARSVRAVTCILDENRPTEGAYAGLIDFENGAVASLVYSGYDHFNSTDLLRGGQRAPESYGATRRGLGIRPPEEEIAIRISTGYGGDRARGGESSAAPSLAQGELGSFIVTCERADLRLTNEGVLAYTTDGLKQIEAAPWRGLPGRGNVIDELIEAVRGDAPVVHHGRWAKATLEVCIAMLESCRTHKDIELKHQVPTVDLR